MTLAELSKGFNIITDLTFDPQFSCVLGLSSEDVKKALQRLIPDNPSKRATVFLNLKKRFNGLRFVTKTDYSGGLFCTNLIIQALNHYSYTNEIMERSDNSEVNQSVLHYLAHTKSGNVLLQTLLAQGEVQYERTQSPQFRLSDLKQEDATFQCTTILFYIGAITIHPNYPNKLSLTSPSARNVLSRTYLSITPDFDDRVQLFLEQGNIAPLLTFMETQGIYKSEKAETFSLQNELAPQSMFVALLNTKYRTTEFEKRIIKEDSQLWIDATSTYNVIQVTEWKNIKLDFLVVPGTSNGPYLSQEECIRKAQILRKMNKEDVYNLKTTSFERFHPNLSMNEIIQFSFNSQALPYARQIQQENPNARLFVHVALSVGTSWILHQTWS